MNIKVLIVDDEFLVRLGMKTYIEESGAQITVCGALASAEEALAFCLQNPVDVLLTDVKMQGMNGIALIREVKARNLHMGIIVLSCHEEFSYAKEALNSGADRYLLKHEIGEAELVDAIETVYRQTVGSFKHSMLHMPPSEPENEEQDAEQYDVFVGILEWKQAYDALFCKQEDAPDASTVVRLLEEVIRRMGTGKCYLHHTQIVCVFCLAKSLTAPEKKARIQTMFYQASNDIYNYFNKCAYLYVAGATGGAQGIEEARCKLKPLLAYRFYQSEQFIVFEEEIPDNFSKAQCPFPNITEYDISNQQWVTQTLCHVQQYFTKARRLLVPPDVVKAEIDELLHNMLFYAKEQFAVSPQSLLGESTLTVRARVEALDSLLLLEQFFNAVVTQVAACAKEFHAGKLLCGQIKQYIHENYMTAISLHSVAQTFSVSPSYLSKMFKWNTGTNFVRYLSTVRVKEAKTLLNTTSLSLDEIAEKAGFSSPNYLIRVFKKVTHQTISEYRKSTM